MDGQKEVFLELLGRSKKNHVYMDSENINEAADVILYHYIRTIIIIVLNLSSHRYSERK